MRWFLGRLVGPEVLAAVTLTFPIYMTVMVFSTLVSTGMSSNLARHLGAGRIAEARAVLAGAHGLSMVASLVLIVLFLLFGGWHRHCRRRRGARGPLGLTFLRITVLTSTLVFLVSVHADALRNEGRIAAMTGMNVLVSVASIGFDYLLIAIAGLGVAGSALAKEVAQAVALAIILADRTRAARSSPPAQSSSTRGHRRGAGFWRLVSCRA